MKQDGGDKMKKGLTILIAVLMLASVIGTAAAVDLEIGRELIVKGTGSFNCDLEVQTEKGYEGQKLEETLYTRWMGTNGNSAISYSSNLEVFISNITGDNRTAEIMYAQTAQTTNAKQLLCSEDFTLGAAVGFYSKGDNIKSFELFTDPDLSEFEIEGTIEGRLKLMRKVIDPVSMTSYMQEVIQLDGEYTYAWNAFAEQSGYPEAGCDDYLACP
jgi:hypothetical protein